VEKAEEELERGAFEPMYGRQDLQFGLGSTGTVQYVPRIEILYQRYMQKGSFCKGRGVYAGRAIRALQYLIARVMAPVPLGRKL